MSDDVIRDNNRKDETEPATLMADLDALQAYPLPAPLRASIDRAIQYHLHAQAVAATSDATAHAPAHNTAPKHGAHRLPTHGPAVRAWSTMLVAVLVVLCLVLVAAVTQPIPGVAPATKLTPTHSVPVTVSSKSASAHPGTWTVIGPVLNSDIGHTATLLSSGLVLVAGGLDRPGAELYNPRSNRWQLTGSMHVGRSAFTATRLLNGQVLVAGGASSAATVSAGSELYNPRTGKVGGDRFTPRCPF